MSGKLNVTKAVGAGTKTARGGKPSYPIRKSLRHQRKYGRRVIAWAGTLKR